MPLPTDALQAQQDLIVAQHLVLNAAVNLQGTDPSAPHAADVLVQRNALAALVAQLPLILLDGQNYDPPSEPAMFYDLVYQVALGMARMIA